MISIDEFKILIDRAEKKDPEAEWELGAKYDEGVIYRNKVMIKRNPKKAYYWYKKAAKHGSSSGQLCLGYCYDVGNGVKSDKQKALYWYQKAFDSGESISASNIASVYMELLNYDQAINWYHKAVMLEDDDALLELGKIYYKGLGVNKNFGLSIKYFKTAIRSNNITESGRNDSFYYLGLAHLEGNGVKKNKKRALYFFRKANLNNDHDLSQKLLQNGQDGNRPRQ